MGLEDAIQENHANNLVQLSQLIQNIYIFFKLKGGKIHSICDYPPPPHLNSMQKILVLLGR